MCQILFIDDDRSSIEDFMLACKDIKGKTIRFFNSTDKKTKEYISNNHHTIDLIVLDIMFVGDGENYYGGYDEGIRFYKSFLRQLYDFSVIIFTSKIPETYIEDFIKHDISPSEIEVIEKNKITIIGFKEKLIRIIN